jgi:hypothetical protein
MPNGQVVNGGLPTFHPSTATAATAFPTSQSMNFPTKTWHTNPAGNPFVVSVSNSAYNSFQAKYKGFIEWRRELFLGMPIVSVVEHCAARQNCEKVKDKTIPMTGHGGL